MDKLNKEENQSNIAKFIGNNNLVQQNNLMGRLDIKVFLQIKKQKLNSLYQFKAM